MHPLRLDRPRGVAGPCIRSRMRPNVSSVEPETLASDDTQSCGRRATHFRFAQVKRARSPTAPPLLDARALVGQRALSAAIGRRAPMTVSPVLDAAGRRRSPATLPGYHAGRPPRNKGRLYPADPPTVEEIIAVMRQTGDDRHGFRFRALIIVLWRGGLRIQEALALGERDLDARRGSLLVRSGKGGRRREIGMDAWAGSSCAPGWTPGSNCRSGRCSASSTARPAGGRGRAPTRALSSAGSPPKQVSGAASRRTSCATPTPSSSRARAWRSTSSSANSATGISAPPRSTCKASTPKRSSPPSTPGARR